jgi:hypothetical protein
MRKMVFIQLVVLVGGLCPAAELIGHWDFEDVADGLLRDRSGHEHHGQVHGAPKPEPGVIGRALRFAAAGDFIEFDGPIVPAGDFTIALWLNCDDTEKQFFLGQYLYQDPERLDLAVREACARIQIDQIVDSEPLVRARRWHHLAYTRSGALLKIFLDGRIVAEAKLPGRVIQSQPLILGKIIVPGRDDFRFTGLMDDLRIWNGPLEEAAIKDLLGRAGFAAD